DFLAEAAGLEGQANLFVSRDEALRLKLTPEDIGIVFEPYFLSGSVIKSKRIFLPRTIVTDFADGALSTVHLADSFEVNGRETPYGFVLAADKMGDDEVDINAWLAETLGIGVGDTLTLRWRRLAGNGILEPDSRMFRVREVLQMEWAVISTMMMPSFPGMEGVDSCADWDVGLPMDEDKLNDPANEAYWKEWRETPKAFISYAVGTNCFGTVFGDAMATLVNDDIEVVRERLQAVLTPEDAGMVTFALAAEGAAAARGSTDFMGLFAGMAFVLVAAALVLASLTLSLVLDTRKQEVALLAATGWPRGRILRVAVAEWLWTLAGAAAGGVALGHGLAHGLVWGLGRFWGGAFAGAQIDFHFSAQVALVAAGGGFLLTLAVLILGVRRLTRQHPTRLWQTTGAGTEEMQGLAPEASARRICSANAVGSLFAAAALAVLMASAQGRQANAAFFGAGALLLASLLLFVRSAAEMWRRHGVAKIGAARAGLCRAAAQMPRRGMAVVALLAVGTFLVIGCLAMKHDPVAGCAETSSGSGGFAAIVTSAVPFERARGIAMARRVSGAETAVPVRVRDGDFAGCLNMNAPVAPQVIGVDAQEMARLRAFEPRDAGGAWSPLLQDLPDGTIPALAADLSMLEYSLKAKAGVGDGTCFEYGGKTLRVVGVLPVRSGILQGSLIVDERHFIGAFPEAQGYRMWLCDYAPYLLREADGNLTPAMRKEALRMRHPEPGITVETAEERLRLLGAVESTYLDMFLVLGGLGMVLGVMGVALVILRGIEERRNEFAVLNALGIPRKQILALITAEYGVLVIAGLLAGIFPALIAIQPAARALGSQMPWGAMAGVVASLLLTATASVLIAAWRAGRERRTGIPACQ
ncbi:MAG: FtsX-like permease family protein, partial [Kiritimatiellaeota bacterium]|nr:FtsX-like permease family protein [Kiritimatiellota bacterium]